MIRTNVILPIKYDDDIIAEIVADSLGFPRSEITSVELRRLALDVTDKANPCYKATVAFTVPTERELGLLR